MIYVFISLGKYLRVKLAGCRVGICLLLFKTAFQKWLHCFILLQCMRVPVALILVNNWYGQFIILAILMDVWQCLIIALICMCLITNDVKCLYSDYTPFTYRYL